MGRPFVADGGTAVAEAHQGTDAVGAQAGGEALHQAKLVVGFGVGLREAQRDRSAQLGPALLDQLSHTAEHLAASLDVPDVVGAARELRDAGDRLLHHGGRGGGHLPADVAGQRIEDRRALRVDVLTANDVPQIWRLLEATARTAGIGPEQRSFEQERTCHSSPHFSHSPWNSRE